jgi:mannan endo-1,4-beta-mannosidase
VRRALRLIIIAASAAAVAALAIFYRPTEDLMLIGVYQPNSPGSTSQVSAFAAQAGFTPRITSYYTSSFAMPFATAFATSMAASGTQVLVQWQPRGTTNAAIAAGQEDAAIIAAARAVASVDNQVIISYGQEMNGNWYDWGNVAPNTAASYVAAYRHIWGVFQAQGVRNVTWLWDPNVIYQGSSPLENWYPGDQYVDWVGLDGYFSTPTITFESLFGPSIAELRTFTFKPLLIGESGVTGAFGAEQLADLFAGADLAGAIGIVYFDEKQAGDAEHQDWRLEDNPANMAEFRGLVGEYGDRPLVWKAPSAS